MHIRKISENNAEDFSKYVNEMGSLLFVYHPGCGHCDNMKPAWEQLEETTEDYATQLSTHKRSFICYTTYK